jgi:Cu(I)/Ag(I) efflux system periplasmic protein CusF
VLIKTILERNNTVKLFTTALLSSILSVTAYAQTATTTVPAASSAVAMPAKDMTEGEVRKVDKETKKITLKHGLIKNLDMPGMTMVFQVKDSALLEKLAVGDKIMFTAERQQGAFVVTGAEKVTPK